MTQQVPIADILAFVFSDAPVGAPVGYAGMSKSLYHTPTTGRVMAYFDSQPNSPGDAARN